MSIKDKLANAKEVDIFADLSPEQKREADLEAVKEMLYRRIAVKEMLYRRIEEAFGKPINPYLPEQVYQDQLQQMCDEVYGNGVVRIGVERRDGILHITEEYKQPMEALTMEVKICL